jgi:hypothetical protein
VKIKKLTAGAVLAIAAMAIGTGGALASSVVSNGTNGTPNPSDQLNFQTVEQYLDVPPNQETTFHVPCPAGYTVLDGSDYVQSLDQGTGEPSDVTTLTSAPADQLAWNFVVHNRDDGNVHVQLQVSCLAYATNTGGSFSPTKAPQKRVTLAPNAFRNVTLTCPAGSIAVAPGWSVAGGPRDGQLDISEPTDNGAGWTFGFSSHAGGLAVPSIHCETQGLSDGTELVETTTSQSESLSAGQNDSAVNVNPGEVAAIGTFSLPKDGSVYVQGREPQGRTELFHLIDNGGSATATEGAIVFADTTSTPPS